MLKSFTGIALLGELLAARKKNKRDESPTATIALKLQTPAL